MPPAWLPVLSLGGFFLISPAKNRFIDRRYQGVPDGAWLAAGLTSLCNRPAGTENPDGEGAFFRIIFYGAIVSTTSGPEPGYSISVLSGPATRNFMLPLKRLGGSPLCLSVSPVGALKGPDYSPCYAPPAYRNWQYKAIRPRYWLVIGTILGVLLILSAPL